MFDADLFCANLSMLRRNADMTQSELADKLNLTRQAVSRYEKGDSFPDISILVKIAKIFNIVIIVVTTQEGLQDSISEAISDVTDINGISQNSNDFDASVYSDSDYNESNFSSNESISSAVASFKSYLLSRKLDKKESGLFSISPVKD